MVLCIAEKPSVGREIAKILGAVTSKDGYMEGNGYWVSWSFGHLCSLQEPQDYTQDWKTWRMECLPMIPPVFKLKLIDQRSSKKQFEVLADLISRCESIVNCGDAAQEGELIQRWIMQKAGCKVPVKRLWISALTEEAIKKGFDSLYPAEKFDSLYAAGSARAIGDWLLGMNATRAYTLKYGVPGQVLSIGRVQTPTLALLVERQKAINNFVPEKYWELRSLYRDVWFACEKGKFSTEEKASELKQKLAQFPMKIVDISEKKSKEYPPRLFDLTLLQVNCNKKFGFSAEHTLSIIQSLYEKKLTTYPRVDTSFLPTEMYKKAPQILENLIPYANFVQPLMQKMPLKKSSKVFNDKKITDHHAIIPTGEWAAASSLSVDEKKVLDLVVRHFIAAFYPDCEISSTIVSAVVECDNVLLDKTEKYKFKASGKQILIPGWRVLFPGASSKNSSDSSNDKDSSKDKGNNKGKDKDVEDAAEESLLPDYKVGEQGTHQPEVQAKQTQPPRAMTEGDLLRAMETAGKQVDNEELRDLMKENGIGRPSTRAAVIETLFKRGYISKEKKKVIPTQLGMNLIEIIQNDLLKSVELTGQWEKKLRQIADETYAVKDFMKELKGMVVEVITQVVNAERIVIGENVKNGDVRNK